MAGAVLDDPKFTAGTKTVTDLSALQYTAVALSAAYTVAAFGAVTDVFFGVLYDAPLGTASVPSSALVATGGKVRWKCAAAIAAGKPVQGDAAGLAKEAVATGYVAGQALTSTSNAGEIVIVDLDAKPVLKA